MPTTITIESQQSPTNSSSRSASRSDSFTDEEGSSGTGVHVPSNVGSHEYSDPLDETWDPVYSDEIEPSESASRPRTSQRYRASESRPPSASRGPTRRHTTTERSTRRPPVSRVHRHPAPVSPSSVDPSEDYPGYGRGYPAPPPGPYGARVPPPGYAPSSYSGGGSGGYAPPFGAAPGALTHYGAPGAYQYPPANPFSPQPAPPMGGAGYFGAPHHSGHSTPGGYPHDPMGGYPQHPGYGGGYPGYMPPGMPPPHMQYYPPQWPHSEHGSATGDPEVEKKLLAIEELMKTQKLDYERAQKELAARDAKDAADKKAAEAAAEAAKKAAEREADAAKKAAEEKASWEKKLEEEKKAARAQGAENAKKAQEAAEKKAAEKAAEEKLKADAKAAEEALAKAKLDAAAELEKAKKEAAEEAEKIKKENAEALAKALEKPAPVEKKKPIKFKDAVGRKFSFPYHLCETWGGMEELIRQAFLHVEVIGPHVAEGHYDLIGPNGEIILPQVWETMIEPDWSITMHMWPMPEPPKGPPGPPPGPPGHGHPFDRPRSGHRHSRHGPPPPPGPPPVGHRGGPPPPPPANWPGGPPRPGPPPGAGPGPGPGPPPPIIVMGGGSGPPRPSRRKTEPPKGVLGWMAGKPAKPSGKGPKKAEHNDACRVM